jgi:hypothetical protein
MITIRLLRTCAYQVQTRVAPVLDNDAGGQRRESLKHFADAEGCFIIREFVEVETGKRADALDRRPQLKAALDSSIYSLYVLYVRIELTTPFLLFPSLASAFLRSAVAARFSTPSHLLLRFVS